MDHVFFVAATVGDIAALHNMPANNVNQLWAPQNQTILHLASRSGKTECVQYIVGTYPDLLDKVDSDGQTALHHAALKGHAEAVTRLLEAATVQGAAFNTLNFIRRVNTDSDSALHLAVRNNHLNVVKLLVEKDPTHTHTKNSKLYTPVYEAAVEGYKDILSVIFETCNEASFDGPDGKTALHAAIEKQDKECVEIIVEKRQQMVALADNKGWTALHYAANHNAGSYILDTLVTRLGNINIVTNKNPLHVAAYKGHIYALIELNKAFGNWFLAVDEEKRNILHMAVDQSHKEMVKYILKDPLYAKKFLGEKDIFGYTPLHVLVLRGCFIPELIKHPGADRTAKDIKGFTPWDLLYLDEEIVAEQLKIKIAIEYQPLKLWFRRSSNPIPDARESSVEPSKRGIKDAVFKVALLKLVKEEAKRYRARNGAQIVVAALVATVTFNAGFSIPGYKYNNGFRSPLSKDTALNTFVITDFLALMLSVSSLFLYFLSSMQEDIKNVSTLSRTASALNLISFTVMTVTFGAGINVLLPKRSHNIAFAATVSAMYFLVFGGLIIFDLIRPPKRMYLSTNSDVSAV